MTDYESDRLSIYLGTDGKVIADYYDWGEAIRFEWGPNEKDIEDLEAIVMALQGGLRSLKDRVDTQR